ncbi:ABC transporter substrate-binding protein [Teredinibacter sp. KSP-S5-2]|uniref:ABC transporter substrate-binding protein n=1 Tax=Teredinibacter sp. KSP-S5-2 TaxID=3034506 RepID=UPI0029347339|nr:extracellular solute-binding protein [Teredinibacter sp. KSP-S5-2]WNO10715.1 extracellular solute-binding protein [Teredinibacter sp. KSP-S5-2]
MNISRRHFLKTSAIGSLYLSPLFASAEVSRVLKSAITKAHTNKHTTLTILYPDGSLPNLLPVTKAFSQITDINFNFIKASVDDINTKILLESLGHKHSFDIGLPATFGIPDLVEANALLDISDYAEQYEPQLGYTSSLYDLGDKYKGKKYGYQTDGDIYLMFYNKSFLQDKIRVTDYEQTYGKKLDIPNTWQELDQQMAFFHNSEKQKYGGAMFRIARYMVWEWWIRFHAKKQLPFKDDMTPNINNEPGIEALEELLAASKYQHPSVAGNGLVDNWKLYSEGRCYANIGWGGTQKYLNSSESKIRGNMLYSSTPEVAYFNWGWNYVVSSQSKYPELSYLFCLFSVLPKQSTLAVIENGFFDPFRKEHYNNPEIQRMYSNEFLNVHRETMKKAIPDLYIEGQGQYMNVLQRSIVEAYNKNISAKDALAYAEFTWQKLTKKIGEQKQVEQWRHLKQQYPKELT